MILNKHSKSHMPYLMFLYLIKDVFYLIKMFFVRQHQKNLAT